MNIGFFPTVALMTVGWLLVAIDYIWGQRRA
jgi:hypothetical protein